MYAADDDHRQDQRSGLKDKVLGRFMAPAALWQVIVATFVVVLAVIVTGTAVTGRITRVESKIDALSIAIGEQDKTLKKLDGKIEALRTANGAQAQQKPATTTTPATPSTTAPQQTTPAPGQIVPKKKP